MVPTMIASVEAMLEGWRHNVGKETEVYEAFSVLTSEVISKTAFGSSYLEGKSIFEMLEKLGIVLFRNDGKVRFPIPEKLYKTADDIESDELEQSLRNSIIAIVNKREEKIKNGEANSYGNDFLGSLINIYRDKDENNRISLDDLIDECKTFYLAGHETTSSSLTWVILLLAIHTDWQQKAREEVLELFGKETPNPEGIAKLKIVNMIICETLRLYPPVTTLPRTVKSKVRLGKLVLPPNIEIFIPPLALHLNPEIWGRDAHLFKPERFLEGVAKATNNNTMAFLPFGYGPRTCVGLNFANTEAKIVLSMILQRYKFTLSPSYVHSPFPFLTIRPQHGVQVVLQSI
ncbi:unnamed protein product [Ilex paraguariensis]|uniref:Cytochrome P450 n=1 Tax=Ilex paraguariensis TaxID=185542 RepID=A0ABC8UJH9_9AQUA